MNGLSLILALGALLSASPSISGKIVDGAGAPVAQARVFLESGLGGALVETKTDASGTYRFDNPPLGVAGVLAVADGYAFGGRTVTVAVADALTGTDIVLRNPSTVEGHVVDHKGKPVAGARITRALLLSEEKVSVPFAKLKALGFEEPVTGSDGGFAVPGLPEGGSVALKIGHGQFAQASPTGLAVGDRGVRVTMNPGVLVRGQALSRGKGVPVANAQIIITRASEPYDTVLARTDGSGNFSVRLDAGVYLGQAATAEFRSPSREKLTVTGEAPEIRVTLYVAGTGAIQGKVADAATGQPVEDAKLVLQANGGVAAHVYTGPTGEYRFDAAEGDNTVTLDSAPGHLPPDRAALRVTLTQGQTADLPVFWLAPIPAYRIQVIDEKEQPVPGAVVSMFRPAQFGWHITGPDGRTDLKFASLPPDGMVVGMAEHPTLPLGALFSLNQANASNARVQLLPLARVTGVAAAGNKKLEGAVVAGSFAGAPFADPVVLWQTLTRDGGAFAWESVVPLVNLKCVAKAGDKSGESTTFSVAPSDTKDLGRIVVSQGSPAKSLYGQSLRWWDAPVLAGTLPDKDTLQRSPAVVMYCSATEAPAAVEGLGVAQKLLADRGVVCAVVVSGGYSGSAAAVPVLKGSKPGAATTYVVGAGGKVVLETFGMPPLRALQQQD